MGILTGIGTVLGGAGGFLIGGPAGAAIGAGIGGGLGGSIDANQVKQSNKGLISQAYRQNVAQANLSQANIREDSNESLNSRGLLTPGMARAPGGTIAQTIAASGGGSGLTPYLSQAGSGAIGGGNSLSGGANAQMTDQFALEDKSNKDAETQALNQNDANYLNTIGNAISQGAGTALNVTSGMDANKQAAATTAAGTQPTQPPGSIVPSSGTMAGGPMQGQFGNVNPQFASPNSGTRIGGSTPNYSFNAT